MRTKLNKMVTVSLGLLLAVLAIAFPPVVPVWACAACPSAISVVPVIIAFSSGLIIIAIIGLVYLVRRGKGDKTWE